MTLNEWQERLSKYFTELRKTLELAGNTRPLFALEHNLNSAELGDLIASLREHLNSSGPAARHSYAWSVYAAEIGYKFKGDEYWQTFAQSLPGWKAHEDRDFIKDAFYRFKKDFRGVVPSGNWAKNFTIICWPITHAILPKDLQRRLARILYEVRGAFTSDLLANTTALGRLIAANSEGTSSRFRKFAEEYDLVGRISVALLSPDSEIAEGLLTQHTLKRITADLQAEQNAHAWLSAAQHRATSVKLTGLKTGHSLPSVRIAEPLESGPNTFERAPQERLELTIKQIGEEAWSVVAALPNLSHIEPSNAQFQRVFTSERSFIDDSEKLHFAPRYFAINRQDILLKSWPIANQSILRFGASPSGLPDLLDRTCSVPSGSLALFRLRDDGAGVYIKSRVVRPGEAYVLLSTDVLPLSAYLRDSKRLTIDCDGVNGILLDVPDSISDAYSDAIKALGLSAALTLRVEPVGYPPKSWNEEGEVEWFAASPKVLSITSTVTVHALELKLIGDGSHDAIQIAMDGHGPVFVDLELLKPGQYQIHMIAQAPSIDKGVVSGDIRVSVIPDDDVILSAENAQGFRILSTPTLPTFEELWAGAAKINIYGPRGAHLRAQLAFYSDPAGLTSPTSIHPLGVVSLPVEETEWANIFERAKRDKTVIAHQEDAVSCRLKWRSLELGESNLHCEREFVPFRWSVRTKSHYHKVKLVQNDSTRELQLLRATFTMPSNLTPFLLGPKLEFDQTDEGGLFVARSGSAFASVVLASPIVIGFDALRPRETRIAPALDAQSLERLCENFGLWTDAFITGDPLLRRKRDAAVHVVRTAIIESICGASWVSAEAGIENGRLRVINLCSMIGLTKDFRFQRLLSEAVLDAANLTDEELESVALDLAQSGHLVSMTSADQVSYHDLLRAFIRLLSRDFANGDSLVMIDCDSCGLALTEPTLMRIMRLLMLARQSVPAEQPVVAGAIS